MKVMVMVKNGNVVCIEVRENKRQLELRDMWDMIILWNPLRQIQNPSLEIFEVISRIERWVHLSRESLRRQAYLIEMSSEQIRQCLCFGEERRLNGKVTLGPPTSYVEMYQEHLGIPARPNLHLGSALKCSTGKTGPTGRFWGSNLSQTLPGQ